MELNWDDFKIDNPFDLTEVQFNRSRKYFPKEYQLSTTRPEKKDHFNKPKKYVWECSCGVKGRGCKNLTSCRASLKDHRKMPGENHTSYTITRLKVTKC